MQNDAATWFCFSLPGNTAVVQTFLSWENDPQSSPQILRVKAHDLRTDRHFYFYAEISADRTEWKTMSCVYHLLERVFEQGLPGYGDLDVLRHWQLLEGRTNKTSQLQFWLWTLKVIMKAGDSLRSRNAPSATWAAHTWHQNLKYCTLALKSLTYVICGPFSL